MRKVAAVTELADELDAHHCSVASAAAALHAIDRMPPISVIRFAIMAGVGAMALGLIFGARHPVGVALIGLCACSGGALRRWLGTVSHNLFVQPFCAALLAGLIGAYALRFDLSGAQRLVAVCPCMVLVPGPHLLNGAIDLLRARIPLGAGRLAYGAVTVLAICTGLLTGLMVGGGALPATGIAVPVPLATDVVAAGFAVAAYGTFFSLPWRSLPVPMCIGMAAHASRWFLIAAAGSDPTQAAFCACLLAGTLAATLGHKLRLPFAALAFASVVSLIPGVLLFRAAGGLAAIATLGSRSPAGLLEDTMADGASALLILLAMTLGLIAPRMLFASRLRPASAG